MSYLDDLQDNLEMAEECLAQIEECRAKGFHTAANFASNNLKGILKASLFCCKCAKRKADKKEIPYSQFECEGGCVRGMSYEEWKEHNKNIWYVFNWTRRHDPRYND